MKNVLLKDSIKEIKNTYKRFISILLMAFLGVGFFAGIRAASPDMLDTFDKYYDDQSVYDINILSTLGLTDDDIEKLEQIENVESVYGVYEKDAIIDISNKEYITKMISMENINIPQLIEGKFPENEDECVVEESFLTSTNKKIGDTIQLQVEKSKTDDGEEIEYLKNNELKIVGTIISPLYISRDRGTSKLGAGKVNYYMYVNKNNINAKDIYTGIYIKVKDAEKLTTSSTKYEDCVTNVKNEIENIKEERQNYRKNQLVQSAEAKIKEAEDELNTQKTDAENQIKEAETDIENAKKEIANGQQTLNKNKEEADTKFAEASSQIQNAKKQIENNEAQLKQMEAIIGQEAYQQEKAKIDIAKQQLEVKEQELEKSKKSTYEKLQNAQNEINESQNKLKDGENELNTKKEEFNEKIADAESKLEDAKQKVNEIENPKWYVLDRESNSGYVGFIQATKSIKNIGKVFPLVFFAVATLISLTSMTRMVEEQRLQIGTLKALGYNKFQIIIKYITYAGLASVIGGFTGMFVGFWTLPPIIWKMYRMMYQLPEKIITKIHLEIGLLGIFLICICIIGATIYSATKELQNTPAVLMRPKAPKGGNRVLLEKIPFIWKHFNFSQKVTVRNIFRYKKRFLMTVIGILGCTSLIVTGFGIKDSIKTIIPNQYTKIFTYDMQINLKDDITEQERQKIIAELEGKSEIENVSEVCMFSVKAINNSNEEDVQVIVPKESFNGLINLKDVKSKKEINLSEDGICLTDKTAQLLGVKSGDKIILKDTDDKEFEVTVNNIVENYVYHYLYMSNTMYEEIFNKKFETNVVLTQNIEMNTEQEDNFAQEIMNQDEVSTITRVSTMMNALDDTLKSLNYVVIILIVSAGLLAFVVLYNLANVNISERVRELATIKVLGFYDNEVYDYIGRESTILTIIGIAFGLLGGYLLNYYVMGTCEINILRFTKIIQPISYLYAIIITIIFTVIVNIATYFALKKIDMIESLKSVE